MSFLKLPLSLNKSGIFELETNYEDYLISRLRIFILSGASRFLLLPSPGISTLWMKLTTLGASSRFCNKDVFPLQERINLEAAMLKEANLWLEADESKNFEVIDVKIIGDDSTPNGIVFRFEEHQFTFTIEFVPSGRAVKKGNLGNWFIKESVNVVY